MLTLKILLPKRSFFIFIKRETLPSALHREMIVKGNVLRKNPDSPLLVLDKPPAPLQCSTHPDLIPVRERKISCEIFLIILSNFPHPSPLPQTHPLWDLLKLLVHDLLPENPRSAIKSHQSLVNYFLILFSLVIGSSPDRGAK
jgi:hypothetical protein